jgi:hypothetical protein
MTKIRDFIAVGTENDVTVLLGVCKRAASLRPMLAGKKFHFLKLTSDYER